MPFFNVPSSSSMTRPPTMKPPFLTLTRSRTFNPLSSLTKSRYFTQTADLFPPNWTTCVFELQQRIHSSYVYALDDSISDDEILIPGLSFIRRDRDRHGGGIAMYVHESVPYSVRTPNDSVWTHLSSAVAIPNFYRCQARWFLPLQGLQLHLLR